MGKLPVDAVRSHYYIDNLAALGTGNRYHLDTRFVIRDGNRHPAAIICPGGGYSRVCSYIEGIPYARALNALGISAFIVYYRCKKRGLFPAPQDDLAYAVRHILEKADFYHINKDNYSVWGSSAGGHLAATFGLSSIGYAHYKLPKPAAIILAYPVISMEMSLTHKRSHDWHLGSAPSKELEYITSVEKHVTTDYPPTYLWCGGDDHNVKPDNTRIMAEALKAAGVTYACRIFPDLDHGLGPGTGTPAYGWINEAVDFWLHKAPTAL